MSRFRDTFDETTEEGGKCWHRCRRIYIFLFPFYKADECDNSLLNDVLIFCVRQLHDINAYVNPDTSFMTVTLACGKSEYVCFVTLKYLISVKRK